jgi:hypothetical protein
MIEFDARIVNLDKSISFDNDLHASGDEIIVSIDLMVYEMSLVVELFDEFEPVILLSNR